MYYPYQAPIAPFLQQTPQPQVQTIQYVNGKSSAESYQMAPNSSVILMDQNLPRFYMKQTDASGSATLKAYDFKEVEAEKAPEYVTKAEFEKFKANLKGGGRHESTDDASRK